MLEGGGGGAFIFSDEKRFISIVNINRQVQQLGTCDEYFYNFNNKCPNSRKLR